MFVMAREFVGALKASRLFACTDETRFHMNCIRVEAVGSALRFTSTDGHTLWCCEVPARDSASDPAPIHQQSWNIALADVDAIAKALRDAVEVEVEILLPKCTINGVVYERRGEDFVKYTNVIPSVVDTRPGETLPEFAAAYVARCCEALALYGRAFAPEVPVKGSKYEKNKARAERALFVDPPIAWRHGGELDPALFYSPKFPAAVALVMPRRGDGNKSVSVESFVGRVRDASTTRAA
jgi:hypothetical protein